MMIIMDLQGDCPNGNLYNDNENFFYNRCCNYLFHMVSSKSIFLGDENARYRKTRKRSSRFIFG